MTPTPRAVPALSRHTTCDTGASAAATWARTPDYSSAGGEGVSEQAIDDGNLARSERRLVAIRPGALGDALLTFPSLDWLRRKVPGLRVTLVARRDVLSLARDSDVADDVSDYDSPIWSALFADEPPARRGRAHELCARACVVAWTGEDDGVVRRNLLALGASAVAVAPGKPSAGSRRHMSLQLCDALAGLGYPIPATTQELLVTPPRIRPSPDARERVKRWLCERGTVSERLAAVHPGSGGAAKRWPTQSFAALLRRLRENGVTPVLIEGPQDAVVIQEILAACPLPHEAAHVARDFSIAELACLLASCGVYVGNDSGVTHLAALADCTGVAMFGPSDPTVWRPLGRRVFVVQAETNNTQDVSLDAVMSPLRAMMGWT